MVTTRILGFLIELGFFPVELLDTLQLRFIVSFFGSIRVERGLQMLVRDRVLHQPFFIAGGFIVKSLLLLVGRDFFQGFQRGASTF